MNKIYDIIHFAKSHLSRFSAQLEWWRFNFDANFISAFKLMFSISTHQCRLSCLFRVPAGRGKILAKIGNLFDTDVKIVSCLYAANIWNKTRRIIIKFPSTLRLANVKRRTIFSTFPLISKQTNKETTLKWKKYYVLARKKKLSRFDDTKKISCFFCASGIM